MKNKIVKALKGLSVAVCCAFAITTLADPPSNAVNPRNAILMNNLLVISNGLGPMPTNLNTFTNVILTAPYQHNMSWTEIISATNAITAGTNTVGSGVFNWTNLFDLGKIVITNNGTTNVYTTNWTTDTPLIITGTGNGLAPVCHTTTISSTNFDGFELIRLTKFGMSATNNYTFTGILGQTP